MSRLDEVEQRLSFSLYASKKKVIFLLSSERDILREMFSESSTLYAAAVERMKPFDLRPEPPRLFDTLLLNGFMVDCYEGCELYCNAYVYFPKRQDERNRAPLFYFITDFHIIEKSKAANFLKQFLALAEWRLEANETDKITLFIVSSDRSAIPAGFENEIELIDVPDLDRDDVEMFIKKEAENENSGELREREEREYKKSIDDFKGLSKAQILEVISVLREHFGTFYCRGEVDGDEQIKRIAEKRRDIARVKREEIAKIDDTITIVEAEDAVAGFDKYKGWLGEIADDFNMPDSGSKYGITAPKGVLFVGVPGSGKTQLAKLTAARLGVTLVQFKFGSIKGSFVGETESKFRQCQKKIEALAPCVVLLDEIEKMFTVDASTHETTRNVLAEFLGWLQENKKPIFFFATCNSLSGIPPELTRDGRFDERYCAKMPDYDSLVDIIALHIKRVSKTAGRDFVKTADIIRVGKKFLDRITEKCSDGENLFYTGANIEKLIKKTQQTLRKGEKASRHAGKKYTADEYANMMFDTEDCQPYGETNMEDIAKFYYSAEKLNFSDASGSMVATGKHEYDKIMKERIDAKVEKIKVQNDKRN